MLIQGIVWFLAISGSLAKQNQYKVVLDEMVVEFVNKQVANMVAGTTPNQEVDISFTPKVDLPEDTKVVIAAGKVIGNGREISILSLKKPLKVVLNMDTFGVKGLMRTVFQPPMIWPLAKGVTHRAVGWQPDSSKFPPNFPAGKYVFRSTLSYGNNTKIFVLKALHSIVYNQ